MIVENEILNAIKFFAVLQGEANHVIHEGNLDIFPYEMNNFANGGRWAMDYTALRHLQYITRNHFEFGIKNILEFGLGVSTDVMLYYKDCIDGFYNLTTYEHDEDWIKFYALDYIKKDEFDDDYWGCIRLSPLQEITYKGQKTLSYENNCTELLKEGKKFELIVIDAPFGQPNYSRPQILFLLPDIINKDNFIIFMDDTERQGEKQTISEICRILNENGIKYQIESYRGEKEHTIICDTNKKYLLSSL